MGPSDWGLEQTLPVPESTRFSRGDRPLGIPLTLPPRVFTPIKRDLQFSIVLVVDVKRTGYAYRPEKIDARSPAVWYT